MLCPRCHRRYADDHRFCPHDGEKLVASHDIRRIRSQPTEHVGAIIAERYRVRGLIGSGAMAQVFLAEDTKSGAPVALKLLEARLRREPKVKARFLWRPRPRPRSFTRTSSRSSISASMKGRLTSCWSSSSASR